MTATFETAFAAFMLKAQQVCDADYATFGAIDHGPKLSAEPGRRYIRIVSYNGSQRSAWAFVDTTNGDVLKSAGWKVPAKGARGCIYDNLIGTGRVRWTGVA